MDLSDGLSSSLYQLGACNQLGFEITLEDIPVSPLLLELKNKDFEFCMDDSILHFGGDYELLFTTSESHFSTLKKQLESVNVDVTKIGFVTRNQNIILKNKNNKTMLANKGYEHFSSNNCS
jgi:thiamine monophosphate kinase